MSYFIVEPEVAGGLGKRTVLDRSVHPPIVNHLHYVFDGWLGDAIVESFPVFVVTAAAAAALSDANFTGARFDEVEVSVSDTFEEQYPGRVLPGFAWLKPEGRVGHDDLATAPDGRLVVSERALGVLDRLGVANALIEPFEA